MKNNLLQVSHLTPFLNYKIWGGRILSRVKGIDIPPSSHPLGETWEVSIHPDGSSIYNGKKLNTLTQSLPYMIKFIDTALNLSIQVHPDDEFARLHENDQGKTECWIVLKAKENSGIYLGFKKGVSKNIFQQSINKRKDISSLLKFHPVTRGDFFFLPPGSIHSIGKDVLLLEIQQSSGVTYRVWDWNRTDKDGRSRKLHIKKAMDVIRFEEKFNEIDYFQHQKNILARSGKILSHSHFEIYCHILSTKEVIHLTSHEHRPASIVCLSGNIMVNELHVNLFQSLLVKQKSTVRLQALTDSEIIWVI